MSEQIDHRQDVPMQPVDQPILAHLSVRELIVELILIEDVIRGGR